jgi:hypothetical protein
MSCFIRFSISILLSVLAFLKVAFMDPGYVTNEAVQFNYDLELQPKSKDAGAINTAKKTSSSGVQLKTKKTSVLSKGLGVVTRTDKLQLNQFNTS